MAITRVNQVWSTDITYIRMAGGFVYLVAVMDWFSRFVLSWALSLTMEVDFCLAALKQALRRGRPEIFNSDHGSQFTSQKFTGELEAQGITVSMDGRGRCLDNIFIERLWRSLKYEEVYLRATQAPEWRGRLRSPLKSDPPVHNLLQGENGLDNRDHFRPAGGVLLRKKATSTRLVARG